MSCHRLVCVPRFSCSPRFSCFPCRSSLQPKTVHRVHFFGSSTANSWAGALKPLDKQVLNLFQAKTHALFKSNTSLTEFVDGTVAHLVESIAIEAFPMFIKGLVQAPNSFSFGACSDVHSSIEPIDFVDAAHSLFLSHSQSFEYVLGKPMHLNTHFCYDVVNNALASKFSIQELAKQCSPFLRLAMTTGCSNEQDENAMKLKLLFEGTWTLPPEALVELARTKYIPGDIPACTKTKLLFKSVS